MAAVKGVVAAISLAASFAGAQPKPDIVIFNEGNPAMPGYYDPSVPFIVAPSVLTTFPSPYGGKLPLLGNLAYSGDESVLLEWNSVSGGDWIVFIATPGFQIHNLTGYSNVVFFVNGPVTVATAVLPRVGLESSTSQRTATVALGNYLSPGLDGDTSTWQRVSIPLTAFQPYGGFLHTQFKTVFFAQGSTDNTTHTVWLDNLRITDGHTPAMPAQVATRAGDRSVILHWTPDPALNVAGYRVYRGNSTNGPFSPVDFREAQTPNHVDFAVINGQDYWYVVRTVNGAGLESPGSAPVQASPRSFEDDAAFLEYVQQTAFDFFWREANPTNGLVRDRSRPDSVSSIAAVGFGLTAIGIGIDHGWITREEGRQRVLTTLQTFWNGAQGNGTAGVIGYNGWFYHMLRTDTAVRAGTSELSSIDSGLLLAGILYVRAYFALDDPVENQIRQLANAIFYRVNWAWMCNGAASLTMGWYPESGFISARWIGYNEAMILYLMGMGALTNPLPSNQWNSWVSGYDWRTHYGQTYVEFPPLFGHQYSHCWVDFRHVSDLYMSARRLTYFENSRRATLANRAYCIANPGGYAGYGSNVWGLTACDGPGFGNYAGYIARGAPPAEHDDGTIAPTAAGGSLPFAPEVCVPALRHMYDQFLTNIWCAYGFRDAFNLSANWWDTDVIGIDQGAILLMAENYRSQNVWRVFVRNPEIQRGLQGAGFTNLVFIPTHIERNAGSGDMMLSWPSAQFKAYQVEFSPDLRDWFISPTGYLMAPGSELSWTDSGPPATPSSPGATERRFYRVFSYGAP